MNFIKTEAEVFAVQPSVKGCFTINVTGHRPDKLGKVYSAFDDKHKDILDAFKLFLWKTIDAKRKQGVVAFKLVSGMALGIDSIFVRAAKDCKEYYKSKGVVITIVAALPCVKQYRKWLKPSRREYRQLLAMCDTGKLVNWYYSAKGMQLRNIYMVDQSDMVVTYWDGTDGGTANCLEYADKKGKSLFNVFDIAKRMKEKRKAKLKASK